jgi:hypothetical protein
MDMKERSFIERIVAILGVLIGTVVWVIRLLFSVLRDLGKKVTQSGSGTAGTERDEGEGTAGGAKSFAADLRTRGESLVEDVASRGQAVMGDTRSKVDELIHRDESGDGGATSNDASGESGAAFSLSDNETPGLSSTQHSDVGGVSLEDDFESGTPTRSTAGEDDEVDGDSNGFMRGIPNLEEPGGDREDLYGSESASMVDDEQPVTDYAGQIMSESDIGLNRGDDGTGLAEGEEILRATADDRGLDADDLATAFDDDDIVGLAGDAGEMPAASRGWQESDDELLADEDVAWMADEIDIENDEAGAAAGMHIVDSPDEPFIDDDAAAQSLGFTEPGSAPAFDTMSGDEAVVDDDLFAADALGNRLGGDAASGDLGPAQSVDDATWDPGSSVPDYDTLGTYAGSGVDTFASDAIAEDMLESDRESGSEESDSGGESGTDTSSVAWASTAGVIDEDLIRPTALTEDQDRGMSAGDAEARTDADDAPGEPGSGREVYDDFSVHGSPSDAVRAPVYNPDDAGLLDVAAETAQGLGEEEGATALSGDDTDARAGTNVATGTDAETRSERPADSVTGTLPGSSSGTGADPGGAGVSGTASTVGGGRRSANVPAGAVRGDRSGVCPADYPIKGNASSHIYHRPTDSSYASTVPEFCFATEEDAKAAGFRARKG